MVTQFGYVVIWSIVWPLAPLFALLNNYFELRSDALKICQLVRRPVGDRVETIGAWLETLGFISWVGAITNAALIYLFRPDPSNTTAGSDIMGKGASTLLNAPSQPLGSAYLHSFVSHFHSCSTWRDILPNLLPLAAVALAASHGYIILKWIIDTGAEYILWRGSPEELQVQRLAERAGGQVQSKIQALGKRSYTSTGGAGGFWNGGEEGAKAISSIGKAE